MKLAKTSVLILVIGIGSVDSPTALAEQHRIDPENVSITLDVAYGHKLGMALTFDVYAPKTLNGAGVAFMNSGGFVSGALKQCVPEGVGGCRFVPGDQLTIGSDPGPIPLLQQFSFESLLGSGFTVFDFRPSSNPVFMVDTIVEETISGLTFIHTHAGEWGLDPDRLGVWGASSGGYLAAMAASSTELAAAHAYSAAVLYYPAGFDWTFDMANYPDLKAGIPALQLEADVLEQISLKSHMGAHNPPTLIIYGDTDFPFIQTPSEQIFARLQGAGVESQKLVFEGTGHEFRGPENQYDAHYGTQAVEEMVSWFQAKLLAD